MRTHWVDAISLVAALHRRHARRPSRSAALTFARAFWPVIGLGVAFELGKLSAAAWPGERNGAGR